MSFVYENSSLNGSKVDRGPIPSGEDPNKWIQAAADWNPTIAAIYDLRQGIINNEFLGIARQVVEPSVPVDGALDFLWASSAGNLYWHKNGSGNQLLNAGAGSLAALYAVGLLPVDQTLLVQSGYGGPVIFKANAASTGSLVQVQSSTAGVLLNVTDNASITFRSAGADAPSTAYLITDTVNTITNADSFLLDIRNGSNSMLHYTALGVLEFFATGTGPPVAGGLRYSGAMQICNDGSTWANLLDARTYNTTEIIYWLGADPFPWAQIQAALAAQTSAAYARVTVVVQYDGNAHTIPAGSYDGDTWSHVYWVANPGDDADMTFASGALITGTEINFAVKGIGIFTNGSIVGNDGLGFLLMDESFIRNDSATDPTFPQCSNALSVYAAVSSSTGLNLAAVFINGGGAPLFDIASGQSPQFFFSLGVAFLGEGAVFGGAGTVDVEDVDAMGGINIGDPGLLSGSTVWGNQFVSPIRLATVAHISGFSFIPEGTIAYETSTQKPQFWDGGAWVDIGSGGGGGTFATTYSSTSTDNRVSVTSAGGPLLLKPGSSGQGALLQAQNSASASLFSVADNAQAYLAGAAANSSTNKGVVLDAKTALTGLRQHLSIQNGGADQWGFLLDDTDGSVTTLQAFAGSAAAVRGSGDLTLSNSDQGTASSYIDLGSGTVQVAGTTQFLNGAVTISPTTNQIKLGAASHLVTISSTAPAGAAQTLTIPDTGGNDTFAFLTLAQTFASKTLTAPIINGATSASGNFDLSGSSGTFKTTTGASTFGGASNTFTAALVEQAAIAATLTNGLSIGTTLTATSGNQKWSSSVHFLGSGWGTGGSAAQAVSADFVLIPVQGTNALPRLSLYFQDGGGSSTKRIDFTRENGQNQIDADTLILTGGTNPVYIGPTLGTATIIGNGVIDPNVGDGYTNLGGSGGRYFKTIYAWWNSDKLGAQLTAATSITPTSNLHHVTGASTIDTIAATNIPSPGGNTANTRLTIIADSATITWSSSGNIAVAGTLVMGKAQVFQYDATATTWYPVQ